MVRRLLVVLVTGAAVAVLVRLSLWQWERARLRGELLNYTYAAEWLLLAVLLVGGVLVRTRRRSRPDDDDRSRDVHGQLIGPPLRPGEQAGEVTRVRLRRLASRRLRVTDPR